MKGIVSMLWKSLKFGLSDGVKRAFNPSYDHQEQKRQTILRHINNHEWADDDVYREFLLYCHKYDKTLRLVRTQQVLDLMLKMRPEVKNIKQDL